MKQKKAYTNGLMDRLWYFQNRRLSDRLSGKDIAAVRVLFDCSVRRVFMKTSTDDEKFGRHTLPSDLPKVDHVIDWIAAGVVNGDEWTKKTDKDGRPRKLMKCGTVDALYREAEDWTKIAVQMKRVELDPAEESVFMELAEGWRIVRMKTETALDRESSIMQHCVGEGSYDRLLTNPSSALLSLRDHGNSPHVTIHLDVQENRLYEVRGKGNAIPKQAYRELMKPFFRAHGFWHAEGASTFYFDPEGNPLLAADLKAGMRVRQVGCLGRLEMEALPAGLIIAGAADLKGADLEAAFKMGLGSLVIEGPTVLSHTHVKTMPARHGFRGDIDMTGSDVADFQEGFRCHGNLRINGNGKLRRLPELLVVRGDLTIKDTPLCALPEHMAVGGNLVIRGTEIRRVPKSANVAGTISLSRF